MPRNKRGSLYPSEKGPPTTKSPFLESPSFAKNRSDQFDRLLRTGWRKKKKTLSLSRQTFCGWPDLRKKVPSSTLIFAEQKRRRRSVGCCL